MKHLALFARAETLQQCIKGRLQNKLAHHPRNIMIHDWGVDPVEECLLVCQLFLLCIACHTDLGTAILKKGTHYGHVPITV